MVGYSLGVIRVFDFNENLIKTLAPKEGSGKKVTAMDVTKSGTHLIAGYETGLIVFWDMAKFNQLESTTKVHKCAIVNIMLITGAKLPFISSDLAGNVNITEISKGFVGYNFNSSPLEKEKRAFAIAPLYPNPLHP